MRCPSCKEEMVIYEYSDVEVDHCCNCGGIWLDAGELEQIIPWERLGFLQKIDRAKLPKEAKLRCPTCAKKMDKVYWSLFPEIILDRCHRPGGGIWFDRDELYTLLHGSLGACASGKEVVAIFKEVFKETAAKQP